MPKKKTSSRPPNAPPGNSAGRRTNSSSPIIAPKKKPTDIILNYAGADECPIRAAIYNSILGRERPLDDLVLSNLPEQGRLKTHLATAFERGGLGPSSMIGVQIARCAITPGSQIEVAVPVLRKAGSFYQKAGVDTISMPRLCPVPFASDPLGFGLACDLVTLIFGEDAEAKIRSANIKSRYRRVDGPERSVISWFMLSDEVQLDAALKKMFTAPWFGCPKDETWNVEAAPPDWGSEAAQGVRGNATLAARAMVPMKRGLVLSGAGKSLTAEAVATAEYNIKTAAQTAPAPLHRDRVPHFFASEFRRRGLDIDVPFVRLR